MFVYRETGGTVVDATCADGAHDGGPAGRVHRCTFLAKPRSPNGTTAC
ncbi:hypothetical protein [Streptomyces sp. NPDC002788]